MKTILFYLGGLLIFVGLAGCTRGPVQPERPVAPKSGVAPLVAPHSGAPPTQGPHSQLPYQTIQYGAGAAGVTFEDSFDDASQILPVAVSNDGEGNFSYPIGLGIHWQEVDGVYSWPTEIRLRSGYRGALALNTNYALHVGDRLDQLFAGAFGPDDPQGFELLKEIYRALEKPDAKNYDCLAERTCLSRIRHPLRIWSWARFELVFSEETKTILEIALRRPRPSLPGGAGFDLLHGGDGRHFTLGDRETSVLASLTATPFSASTPGLTVKEWQGISLGFQPTKNGNRLRVAALDGTFLPSLLFGGMPIVLPPERTPFQLNHPRPERSALANLSTITSAVQTRAAESTPYVDALPVQFNGLHRDERFPMARATLILAKKDFSEGRVLKFHYSPEDRCFHSIEVSALDPELDVQDIQTAKAAREPLVVPTSKTLAGRSLGEIAIYETLSIEKGTATLKFTESGDRVHARVEPTAQWEAEYPIFGRRRTPVHTITIGQSLPVTLQMLPTLVEEDGQQRFILATLAISTRHNPSGVRNLCERSNVTLHPGDRESELWDRIAGASGPACERTVRDLTSGARQWVFTHVGLGLQFESGELTETTIYTTPEYALDRIEKAGAVK